MLCGGCQKRTFAVQKGPPCVSMATIPGGGGGLPTSAVPILTPRLWHLPWGQLPKLHRHHMQEAFSRLSDPDTHRVSLTSVPTLLAAMNVAVLPVDVERTSASLFTSRAAKKTAGDEPPRRSSALAADAADATLVPSASDHNRRNEAADLTPSSSTQPPAAGVAPSTSPPQPATPVPLDSVDFAQFAQLYDNLVPVQMDAVGQYLAFFNLLDVNVVSRIRVQDLRHALCRLGDAPISEQEFDHMLFKKKLLHRDELTPYEFLYLLLDVPMDSVVMQQLCY